MTTQSAVVLFRDPARGESYIGALAADHGTVECIPVLEHRGLLSATDVERIVGEHTGGKEFAALIFTSQNAVHALSQAASEWTGGRDAASPAAMCDRAIRWRQFLSTPIFAVGRATGETCRSQLHGGWVDSCDIRGEESGNATTLLPEIIRFCRECQSRTGARPRLAFFCGDQRRDTLPRGVGHSDCAELCEIVSYTTAGRSQSKVGEALLGALARAAAAAAAAACHRRDAQREQGTVVWLVLFSPSGARVVVPIAQRLARQGVLGADAARPGGAVVCRFAAIGETTAAEIAALGVDAQSIVRASEPDEQGVGRALRLAEARPPPVAGPLAPQEAH